MALYAENGSARKTSKELKLPYQGVLEVIRSDKARGDSVVQEHRALKRISVIDKIAEVQLAALDALLDPDKLKAATTGELVHIFVSLTDKRLLLTGSATTRIDIRALKVEELTADELDAAANIRAKLQAATLVRNQDLYEPIDVDYHLPSEDFVVAEG